MPGLNMKIFTCCPGCKKHIKREKVSVLQAHSENCDVILCKCNRLHKKSAIAVTKHAKVCEYGRELREQQTVCPICGVKKKYKSVLDEHLRGHEKGTINDDGTPAPQWQKTLTFRHGRRKCPVCKTYVDPEDMTRHAKEDCGDIYVGCACGRFIKNTVLQLAAHSARGKGCPAARLLADFKLSCPDCGKLFANTFHLNKHTKSDSTYCKNDRPLSGNRCPGCDESFATPYDWRIHSNDCEMYKTYMEKGKVKCPNCERRIASHPEFLAEHAEECGAYLCKCGKLVVSDGPYGLAQHASSTNCKYVKEKRRRARRCNECNITFPNRHKYYYHMRDVAHKKDFKPGDETFECKAPDCVFKFKSDNARKGHQAHCKKFLSWKETPEYQKWFEKQDIVGKRNIEVRKRRKKLLDTERKVNPLTFLHKIVKQQVIQEERYDSRIVGLNTFSFIGVNACAQMCFYKQKTCLVVGSSYLLSYNNFVRIQNLNQELFTIGWRVLFVPEEKVLFQTEQLGDMILGKVEDESWKGLTTL